jgi:hypothetical protein
VKDNSDETEFEKVRQLNFNWWRILHLKKKCSSERRTSFPLSGPKRAGVLDPFTVMIWSKRTGWLSDP